MDATPIVLPQAAGRPPLKRDILPSVSTTAPTSSHRKSTPFSSSGFTRRLSTGTGLSSISMSTASWSNRAIFANSVSHSISVSSRRSILPKVSSTAPISSHGKSTPYSSSGFASWLSTGTGLSSMSTASLSNRTIFASSVSHSITASWKSSSTASVTSGTFINSPESSANTHNISVTGLSSAPESNARSGPTVHDGGKGRARISSKIGPMQSPGNISTSSLTTLRVSPSSPPSVFASLTASPGTVPAGSQSRTDFTASTNSAGSSFTPTRNSLSVTSSTNVNPTGAVARSSALALQSQIIAIGPKIQSYVNMPSVETADVAIAALLATLPMALV